MRTFKKTSLIIFWLLMCNCYLNQEDPLLTNAKQTAQNVFRFYLKSDYDSLRIVIPDYLKSSSDDNLKIHLSEIARIIQTDGIPELSDFKVRFFDPNTTDFCTLVLIPKSSINIGIDSVVFKFDKFTGVNKVAILDPFEKTELLHPIETK